MKINFIKSFFLCFTLFGVNNILAQCPSGRTKLHSQQDIIDFKNEYPNCQNLNRSLYIGLAEYYFDYDPNDLDDPNNPESPYYWPPPPVDITDLSLLSNIKSVDGSFIISHTDSLLSLNGLDSLETVRGLKVEENKLLQNFNGLTNLKSAYSISVSYNYSLENIHDLIKVDALYSLGIIGNGKLKSLHGLDNILHVADYVSISNNYSLEDLSGLNRLFNAPGHLFISGNSNLKSLNGLDNFQSTGSLFVWRNSKLASLVGLKKKLKIYNTLQIYNNDKIVSLNGLEKIEYVRGPLLIEGNNYLQNINSLENVDLSQIKPFGTQPALRIKNNTLLNFCSIESICNAIQIVDLETDILNNGKGCTSSDEISELCDFIPECMFGSELILSKSDYSTFKESFSSCEVLSGDILIVDTSTYINNENVINLEGLESLDIFNGDIIIEQNKYLDNLGFENLMFLNGNLIIRSNVNLDTISGFDKLANLNGDLEIDNNYNLKHSYGLSTLNKISNNLIVRDNPLLVNFLGMDSLRMIHGDFRIEKNGLQNFEGLGNLELINGHLLITENPNLLNLVGMNNLKGNIGSVFISRNEKFMDFSGFEEIDSIQGNFQITNLPRLESLEKLSHLKSIGNELTIHSCSIKSLKGIENVELSNNQYAISIAFCDSLSFCNVRSICGRIKNMSGGSFRFNNSGCSDNDEVQSLCCNTINKSYDSMDVGTFRFAMSCSEDDENIIVDKSLSIIELDSTLLFRNKNISLEGHNDLTIKLRADKSSFSDSTIGILIDSTSNIKMKDIKFDILNPSNNFQFIDLKGSLELQNVEINSNN